MIRFINKIILITNHENTNSQVLLVLIIPHLEFTISNFHIFSLFSLSLISKISVTLILYQPSYRFITGPFYSSSSTILISESLEFLNSDISKSAISIIIHINRFINASSHHIESVILFPLFQPGVRN